MELPPRYTPQETEEKWLKLWEEQNIFHAEVSPDKKPFSVVIPPPNVTGILHMGHALNCTLQDILVRYKRMQGFEALWMPGTDHAGIATQNVVEKQIAKEGLKRQDLGREEFLKRLWQWKQQYGDTIIHQLKKLGASCDWSRTRFTMDEHYSEVVKHVFIELYKKDLIYQGQYIINWCPRCQTALSDEEAEHEDKQGSLYYIRYPFKDNPDEFILVATTRPETMLGDTAVAVNPKDKRYKKLIGRTLVLPLMNREIKIIGDNYVDPKFGTGAVKVTPAHDPNDFDMGKRHNLAFINIMHPDGRMNENAKQFKDLDRFKARQAVLEALKTENRLEKIETHAHAVGHCYRCHTVVEPYLSRQWFVRMKPFAKKAVEVVKKGEVKFLPNRWTKVYLNWMENIRDWCISRQIWWGHRIPVWYCRDCEKREDPIVALNAPTECPHCHSKNIFQDNDVLDTWFSSWLWPFATFYWPKKSEDLNYFYPTTVLSTASEIIFFWVARMIMAGLEFTGKIPFSDVIIHGTVRDAKGRKMSKSLGNTIDPLEIIHEYGADALRFSLIINSGQDLYISKEKFEIGRNFANKIWNATRLILMNIPDTPTAFDFSALKKGGTIDLPSRWILSRLYKTREDLSSALEKYRFSEAETLIYDFFWKNFCDWYLEIIKDKFSDSTIQQVVLFVLEQSILMLHPFMPFVTEEIWHILHPQDTSLTKAHWPKFPKQFVDKEAEKDMGTLVEIVSSIRNVRTHWNIDQAKKIDCLLSCPTKDKEQLVRANEQNIIALGKLNNLTIGTQITKPKDSVAGVVESIKFFIPLAGIIDVDKEKQRIKKQTEELTRATSSLAQRLKNKDFLKKAPKDVVEKEKNRLAELNTKLKELNQVLKELN